MSDSHLGNELFDDPDDAAGGDPDDGRDGRAEREARPRRGHGRHEEDRPVRRRGCGWIAILVALVLVIGGGYAAYSALGPSLPTFGSGQNDEGDYSGTGTGSVSVRVEDGDSGAQIGRRLQEAGVVKSARLFTAVLGTRQDAARLQPGTYTLRSRMSAASAVDLLLDPAARKAGVTIPEGLWASEIYTRLSRATDTPIADYRAIKADQLDLPAGAGDHIEGYLFPSTYEFPENATAVQQVRALVARFKSATAGLDIPADRMHRVLTVASLVQAESRLDEDGPKVARVIENRLRPGNETRGRLQMDSTVHYGIGKRGTVTTTAQERSSGNKYNTYRISGLPPGPINNPGLDAIKAALAPAKGDWLYFVTVNQATGETTFAATAQEHQKNVKEFQAWCQANKGKC